MPCVPPLLLLAVWAIGSVLATDDLPIYSVNFHASGMPSELRPSAQPMTRQAQRWLCHLNAPPPPTTEVGPAAPQSPAVVATKLQQLFGGRCFVAAVGWWRYEFCGEKWVRQYHEEQGVVTAEFVLGLGPKALANDVLGNRLVHFRDGAQKIVSRLHGAVPRATGQWEFTPGLSHTTPDPYYHTVFYDGTACDLTGGRREIEIQAHCAFDAGLDGSFTIVERATCAYQLVFHSTVLCSWPEVVPAASRRRVGVVPRSAAIDCYSDATLSDVGTDVPEKIPGGTGVSPDSILDAFGTTCFYRFEDWWTYHFCWQRWLRQYRSEGERLTMHLWLGLGPKAALRDAVADTTVNVVDGGLAATDGERTLLQLVETRQPFRATGQWFLVPHAAGLPPHYASVLPEGDFCSATGVARRTVVRLLCTADPMQNNSFEVRETDQCEYSALFYSTVPCSWQPLKDAYQSRFLALPEPLPASQRPSEVPTEAELRQEYAGLVPPGAAASSSEPLQEVPLEDKSVLDQELGGGCFSASHGWWTYEWCYDKWIKQFHQEKGVVLSEYFLGLGVRALAVDSVGKRKVTYADGARSALQKLEKQPDPRATGKWVFRPASSNQGPHYSTWYFDGTACEGGMERSAEIKLYCVDSPHLDLTLRVLESRPCLYTVIVQSPKVCEWPQPQVASPS